MKKKLILLALALLLTAAAHCHVSLEASVNGTALPGRYSPAAVREGRRAAEAAAEELLCESGKTPPLRLRGHLSLSAPQGESSAISDALLRATKGVSVETGVFVNGFSLGHVAEGKQMAEALRRRLYEEMPAAAVSGRYSAELSLRPMYTVAGRSTSVEDMLFYIQGCCPVLYTDSDGRLILG